MLRYALGDLSYPTMGFQAFRPMAGFSIARNFSLQPYLVTEPMGQTSFFLKNPSKVDVFVNGQQVQTLQLPAGPQNVRNFLFTSGANDVDLRITDDVGRVETVHMSFFFDTRLLAAGQQEFSYNVGLPSQPAGSGYNYDSAHPTLSLFHHVGLTDELTAGGNFQGNTSWQLLGADAVWAQPFGTLQSDIAFSRADRGGVDYALRLGYRYYDATSAWGSTWAASAQYQGPSFSTIGTEVVNLTEWEFSARYSQRWPWRMTGGIGGTFQLSRNGQRDLTGLELFLSKRLGRAASIDLTLDRQELITGQVDYRAMATFMIIFPEDHQSVRASYDTLGEVARSEWQYMAPNPVGGFDGSLGAERTRQDYGFFGTARYVDPRGEIALSHDISDPVSSRDALDSRTSLRMGTALVYADGNVALSRPVENSFAIFAANPDFKSMPIMIEPNKDSRLAQIDRVGPAVLPDLTPYIVRRVSVDAPELPLGYELGPGSYVLRPTYKSGTVIHVGEGIFVILTGSLAYSDGKPVSLQAGEVAALGNTPAAPIEFFTNRAGRFSIDGLKAGRYELRIFDEEKSTVQFEVPKGKVGPYDLGRIRLASSSHLKTASGRTGAVQGSL
jgi:outer membrane usher protein